MLKPLLNAAVLGLALGAGSGAAGAEVHIGSAMTGVHTVDYRPRPFPRPFLLSERQIVQRLYSVGWWSVRRVDRHVWYYTARADSRRGTFDLVINGFDGRVISAHVVDHRRR